MNKSFKIILLVFFVNLGFSQKKPNVECGYFGKKTVEERNKMFPFSDAKEILLIAFPNRDSFVITDNEGGDKMAKDSLDFVKFGFKITKTFNFKHTDSLQRIETYMATKIVYVEEKSKDDLSNVMFNYKLKINRYPYSTQDIKCYTPRHALLFLDKAGEVISVFEICFECHKYYLIPYSRDIDNTLGVECDKRLDYFKELFLKNGFEISEH